MRSRADSVIYFSMVRADSSHVKVTFNEESRLFSWLVNAVFILLSVYQALAWARQTKVCTPGLERKLRRILSHPFQRIQAWNESCDGYYPKNRDSIRFNVFRLGTKTTTDTIPKTGIASVSKYSGRSQRRILSQKQG